MGKKFSKPTGKEPERVIARPTVVDLSSSMDEYDAHLEARSDLLAPRVDSKDA